MKITQYTDTTEFKDKFHQVLSLERTYKRGSLSSIWLEMELDCQMITHHVRFEIDTINELQSFVDALQTVINQERIK